MFVILDNDISKRVLDIESPTYTSVSRFMMQNIEPLSASLRFLGARNADITEFQTNFVRYPTFPFHVFRLRADKFM